MSFSQRERVPGNVALAIGTLSPETRKACLHVARPSGTRLHSAQREEVLPHRPPLNAQIMWFTAISPPLDSKDRIGPLYIQAAKTAILSARFHAPSLQPHLMYLTQCTSATTTCGKTDALTRWMGRHGVRVHFWRLSFWSSLPESAQQQRNPGTLNSYGT